MLRAHPESRAWAECFEWEAIMGTRFPRPSSDPIEVLHYESTLMLYAMKAPTIVQAFDVKNYRTPNPEYYWMPRSLINLLVTSIVRIQEGDDRSESPVPLSAPSPVPLDQQDDGGCVLS